MKGHELKRMLENLTFNHGVVGSKPTGLTIKIKELVGSTFPQNHPGKRRGNIDGWPPALL